MNQLQANGGTTREAEMVNDNVRRMLAFGRQLSTANAPAAPANPPPKKN